MKRLLVLAVILSFTALSVVCALQLSARPPAVEETQTEKAMLPPVIAGDAFTLAPPALPPTTTSIGTVVKVDGEAALPKAPVNSSIPAVSGPTGVTNAKILPATRPTPATQARAARVPASTAPTTAARQILPSSNPPQLATSSVPSASLSTVTASPPMSGAPPAAESTIEVPQGASVPMALMDLTTDDGFTPSDLQKINSLGDQFVAEATQGNTGRSPNPTAWDNAQRRSDELFRTWYGDDAYNALTMRRFMDARQTASTNP